jgi:KaiC/GvpD/RAD55 family RecA-like ATPase
MTGRISTGIAALDEALGGGLLPGSLTLVLGATGVGKTQFGIQLCAAGRRDDGVRGTIVDLSSRGDSQNHVGYAKQLFGQSWSLADPGGDNSDNLFSGSRPADILPFLGYGGRRVLRSQMDADGWHAWQSELNRRLPRLFRFVYGHLVHGTRRFVIDGIEPQTAAHDSLQVELLELIYHRMLRQEYDWLAREVLREKFRGQQALVDEHRYRHEDCAAVALVTTRQSMLEQLMSEPLADGDLAAGANTVILLGRQRQAEQMGRALFIAKHRGSYADQRIIPFAIGQEGMQL